MALEGVIILPGLAADGTQPLDGIVIRDKESLHPVQLAAALRADEIAGEKVLDVGDLRLEPLGLQQRHVKELAEPERRGFLEVLRMQERGEGHLLNVTSASARRASRRAAPPSR